MNRPCSEQFAFMLWAAVEGRDTPLPSLLASAWLETDLYSCFCSPMLVPSSLVMTCAWLEQNNGGYGKSQ